ncbi:MAG TPA: hypothetical protein V6C65_12610 [Allocoleopsis sp.]
MKLMLVSLIKSLSIVLMTGAIGLELWQLESVLTQSQQPAIPLVILWMARFALIVHGMEGIIAAVYATRQQRPPLFHAVYTFFVGTVGLVELYNDKKQINE